MKLNLNKTRRGLWIAVTVISLLLCGAGTVDVLALSEEPVQVAPATVGAAVGAQHAAPLQQDAGPAEPDAPEADAAASEMAEAALTPDALTDGLLGYWKLDETSGHPYDSSTNNLTATVAGTLAYSATHAPVPFADTHSLYLNDNGFYTVALPMANSSFTLATWAKRDGGRDPDFTMNYGMMSQGTTLGAGQPGKTLGFGFTHDDKIYCGFNADNGALMVPAVGLTEWHHWACTYDVSTNVRKLYRDGVQIASDTASEDFTGGGDFFVGTQMGYPVNDFMGYLDEARVYDRELTAAEMKVLGQTRRRPISYWKLNGNGDDSSAGGAYDLDGSSMEGMSYPTTGGAPTPFSNAGYASLPEVQSWSNDLFYAYNNPEWNNYGGQVTVAAWVRPFGLMKRTAVMFNDAGTPTIYSLKVDSGVVTAEVLSSANATTTVSGGALTAGEWAHIAFTFNKNDMLRLYVNGTEVASAAVGDLRSATYPMIIIGYPMFYGGIASKIDIDDVRIYDRLLNAEEVAGLAAAGSETCYAYPDDALEGSDGTVYASTNAAAVQAGLDLLGAGGGTVKLSGSCTGTATRSSNTQTALITTGPPESSVTLDGGWNSTFTTQNPRSTPTTLDAASGGRVVLVANGSAGSAFLNNMTLTHGSGAGGGGLLTYAPTTLEGVTVSANTSSSSGGGIYATTFLTMTNSTVSGNTASAHGGGLFEWSGGSYNFTIKNSTFSGNFAASRGGAIFIRSTTLRLANVTLTDNEAGYVGPGIENDYGTIMAKNSIIAGNHYTNGSYSGDVYNYATWTTLGGNILGNGASADYDQTVSYDKLRLGTLADNGGATQTHLPAADSPAIDAGICASSSEEWWYVNSDQRGSSYTRPGGGTVYCDAGAVEAQSVTPLCFASRSTAAEYSSVNARALQTAIENLSGGTGTVRVGGTCSGVAYMGGTMQTAKLGGGITLIGGDADSYLTTNPNGRAVLDGDVLSRVLLVTAGTNTVRNLQLTGGLTSANGAGLLNQGTLTLENSLIQSNGVTGSGLGGGLANEGTLTVNDSTVSANTAASHAGGIYNKTGTLTLNRVTVSANTSSNYGGGIYNAATLNLARGSVTGNTATNHGGGLWNSGTADVINTTISGNTVTNATGQGGGIFNYYGTNQIRILFSTITNNTAGKGAGIALNSSVGYTKVGGSIVSGNHSGDDVQRADGTVDFTSLGYNVIGSVNTTNVFRQDFDQVWVTDPKLAALSEGKHALLTGGAAIDAGACSLDGSTPGVDQAGATRPGSGSSACDVGAVELQGVTAQCTAVTGSQTFTSVNGRAVQMAVDASGGGTVTVSGACEGAWRKSGGEVQLAYTANNLTLTTNSEASLDAGDRGRVLTVAGGTTNVTGPGLTLTGGAAGRGGGLSVASGATAVVTGTQISGNTAAARGGGAAVAGTLNLTNSTVSDNASGSLAYHWVAPSDAAGRYRDSSAFGNHGTCYGGTCPVYATVGGSGGLQFSAGNVVRVPNNDSLDPGTELTLAAWVYVPTPATNQKLFGKVASGYRGYYLGINASKLDVEFWDTAGTIKRLTSSATIPANGWTHLAVTWRSGGSMIAYVNGVQSTSITASSLPIGSTTTDFILGAAPWSTGSYKFTGTLQDMRVYHKELSADQVWDLKNNVDPEALEAGGWGGGIYQAGASQVTIEASSLIENAAGRGGGLYQEGGTFTGRNLTISTNTAAWSGGGLWHAGGDASLTFATVAANSAPAGNAANIHNASGVVELFGSLIGLAPTGVNNCAGVALTSRGGYNMASDDTCGLPDGQHGAFSLGGLTDNGGPTLTHKPARDATIVDIIPRQICEAQFEENLAIDQRWRDRPRVGIVGPIEPLEIDWQCDAGALELGSETLRVCGPPLLAGGTMSNPVFVDPLLCDTTSLSAALSSAQPDDTIVVTGVVTETVTIDQDVTIRGPTKERTPAWHMGIVQAQATAPTSAQSGSPIFTIDAGVTATIQDLNIRYGRSGAIKNLGTLTLDRVTIYDNRATQGAAIYSSGAMTITNSTLSGNTANSGAAAVYVSSTGTLDASFSTFKSNGPVQIKNDNPAANSAKTTANIFNASSAPSCAGVTTGGYNLSYPSSTTCPHEVTGDPMLGSLRDNGGVTLTSLPATGSFAIAAGPPEADCPLVIDQRLLDRPITVLGESGGRCDAGSVEAGSRTLRVCTNCEPDPAARRFSDLQAALDSSGTGDIIEIEAGEHTGAVVVYHDATIRHAGLDMSKLHRELPVDVRAILQASERPVAEQRQLGLTGSTVLRIESYTPTGTSIVPGGDITVVLQDLTLRNGLARLGGGIFNRGNLTVERCTIAENAVANEWNRTGWPPTAPTVTKEAQGGGIYNLGTLNVKWSTLSGNVSEAAGGALSTGGGTAAADATLVNTTLANNKAARLPDTYLVGVKDTQFEPAELSVLSEDAVRFENRTTGQIVTLSIMPGTGVTCQPAQTLPLNPIGVGPSDPLICKASASGQQVTITDGSTNPSRVFTLTLVVPEMRLQANSIFADENADVTLTRSLISDGTAVGDNCALRTGSASSTFTSGHYNLIDDNSCVIHSTDLQPGIPGYAAFELGPLQDNNAIDFDRPAISGYTDSHALRPGNPGIDHTPLSECQAADVVTVDLTATTATEISAGDAVIWTNDVASTVALNDGQAGVRLIEVPGPSGSTPVQLTVPGDYTYRAYDATDFTEDQAARGTLTVRDDPRPTDQRGMALPQRGATDYKCDVGAVEYQPWVVGTPLLRPPSAVGTQPPTWSINDAQVQGYDMWSGANSLDIPIAPTPLLNDGKLEPDEWAAAAWDSDPRPSVIKNLVQYGTVEWPDAPQVHVAGAPVSLGHDKITDGFTPSGARAFDNRAPDDTLVVLSSNTFTRTLGSGVTYTVVRWGKGTSSNALATAQVIRTYDPKTPGILDLADRSPCVIGSELIYPAFDGLPGHEDPEGKSGMILAGTAFDGVQTAAQLQQVRNTTDNLIEPAHVRDTRTGPILPVLAEAPTLAYAGADPVSGGHDLEVAWYRPDDRKVAWPVKTAGYRCDWPANPPNIVIASELGSEIDGQEPLVTTRYVDTTIYHQVNENWPGYSPNYEHALLAPSNTGLSSPALYALRTDLADRDTGPGTAAYALLKYRDALQANRIQMRAYKVLLTREATSIGITPDAIFPGTIEPMSGAAAPADVAQLDVAGAAAEYAVTPDASAATAGVLTFRISDGRLASNGTSTVPLQVSGATGLRSMALIVTYPTDKLAPVRCAPNQNLVAEKPYQSDLSAVDAQQNVPAGQVVHLSASVEAGTGLRYLWKFGDEEDPAAPGQYDAARVSHVYATSGSKTVTVIVSNALFPDDEVTLTTTVTVAPAESTAAPGPDPWDKNVTASGCRFDPAEPGKLRLDLRALNKHGLTGVAKLADLTFNRPVGYACEPTLAEPDKCDATVGLSTASLLGPDYSRLDFGITAGNPVYAPTPVRNLLDIQPCAETVAADDPVTHKKPAPFWKDWKGMLWARAAGNMSMSYFYPLQPGFYLDNAFVTGHGLPANEADRVGLCVPWLDALPDADYPAGTATISYVLPDGETTKEVKVYPTSYTVSWPKLPALLDVGETVYQRAKAGVSAVASQVAVSRVYDDLARGEWNNDVGKIEITGPEVMTYLTSLIDPISEVAVKLDIEVDGVPGVPAAIKTERLLFGGGLSIAGNTSEPDKNLPFSLRSRILARDGYLIFRGYYDGTSPEYIKGDPLLLLNVMAESDKQRLLALCHDGSADCATFNAAIEALYWKTQNPRQLDLCRFSNGKLDPSELDRDRALNQGPTNPALSERCPTGTGRDGVPDHAFLISEQDTLEFDFYDASGNTVPDGVLDTGDGIPEPYEGVGKGKALTAGNAAGTGYVTLAYNNDSSLGGLPVSLQVIKVQCAKNADGEESPYRGNVLVIKSDNLFDEKVTLRHTGDFGGRPDNFEFEWWIAAVDETAVSPTVLPESYPWHKWTKKEPGMSVLGPEITIEGANPTTLRDNWVIVRYKNTRCPVCGNMVRYSAFAGDPSAKPSEVRAQLAEGWIKRVVDALNPFDTRVDDFVGSQVSSSVDMIRQAGPRYEGPIAMNADPENLNKVGLIEAYQTILERGRSLSIDSHVNDQGANAALLNVTSRIAQLYMLLGNDAYIDALDPIVGFDDSTLGIRASAVYAFANQYRPDQFGPIDEELALLRGRDQTLGGVAAAPTYNRLTWNFTNGEGEVAYVTNYNIDDINLDGFINEADAAIMFPQGHGDAYGQQLTALTLYYQLLRHPDYTWVPRAEPVSVAGAPVVVDYYDERRFAAAAAARARMGAEVVSLTYRKNYAEPEVQPYRDSYVDSSDNCDTGQASGCNKRAWGVADWAGRSAEGAYYDWLMANAILPPVDDRYSDVRKIDRTTVEDIAAIADQILAIQTQLDRADEGVNPLGVTGDAVLFDLDPALTKSTPGGGEGQEGGTHFEQVYDKTLSTVANSLKMFVFANQAKDAQRKAQDEQHDFAADIIKEDREIINELIEIFGYPYDKDIGINGTYPEGYDGPDIYNYNLIERTDLTNMEKRCDTEMTGICRATTTTELVEFPRMECLGHYVHALTPEAWQDWETVCPAGQTADPDTLKVKYEVGIGLDKGRGRYLPSTWVGASRQAWGEAQNKLWSVYDKRVEYEKSIEEYQNLIEEIEEDTEALKDHAAMLDEKGQLKEENRDVLNGLDGGIIAAKEIIRILNTVADILEETMHETSNCVIRTVGMAVSAGDPAKCTIEIAGSIPAKVMKNIASHSELAVNLMELGKSIQERNLEIDLFYLESDYELRQQGRELQGKIREEREKRLDMFLAADNFATAQQEYTATVQKGYRKLAELIRLRKRWAGQIMSGRYSDMAYRIAENDALQKYRQQFDLAQLYTYMAATAYDYETNLRGDDPAAADKLIRRIVGERSLGELRWNTGAWDLDPIVGSGGLADVLGRLRDNFRVLKGQMGFNNPQSQTTRFSLRQELFRLRDSSDAAWKETLQRYYTPNIYANPTVSKLAKKPYGATGPQPGLVIPFGTTIRQGLNFFELPLGPGDGAYNPTNFSTKIASIGVWFEGYDTERLAGMPYVYLLPGGEDVLRPRNTEGTLRYWNVTEQLLPLPYPITVADMANARYIPGIDGLQGRMYQIKPYAAFQAFPYTEGFSADQTNTDTRLIGRSVWNTEWVLVIPGANLLADPEIGIDRFMQDVDDIYVYFQTYAYAGTMAASAMVAGPAAAGEAAAVAQADAAAVTPNPIPQPDVIFYGVALRDGVPLSSGTLKAILPRGDTVTAEIGPITGTPYNYELAIPLAYYDTVNGPFAPGSARVGENISFTIDGVPALLKDTDEQNYQAYIITAPGNGYVLTVDVSGPGSYPIGDVNVSGKRDAADALLVLKYDVGLTPGITTWPPGPATVYLPLCDVTEDGACNSSDALRILLCEVDLASCGPQSVTATNAAAEVPADAPPVYLSTEQEVDTGTGQVVVRVRAESPGTPLAVASLGLRYDPVRVSVEACAENPAGRLDLAVCNPAYITDTVRYTGITTGGIVEAALLLELRLRPVDATVLQQIAGGSPAIEIAEAALFDLEGNALRPVLDSKEPATTPRKVFLPVILAGAGSPGTEVAPEPPAAEPTPEPTAAEPTPELQVEPTAAPTPEVASTPEPPAAEATPEVAPTLAAQ